VCKCTEGVYVKYGEGVFAIVHAALREDHRDEVDAGGAKQGERGGFGEELQQGQYAEELV
jgi:hypothetical protein